jgi:hypothetical protein
MIALSAPVSIFYIRKEVAQKWQQP